MEDFVLTLIDYVAVYLSTVGGGFIMGVAATYWLMRRRSARELMKSDPSDLDRRVALLEEELAASRSLVEQLSEGKH